ncbi:MAG: tRNA (guanosine(37)-N1)-methyltransferase TrmD [Ardenticatenaceae bacterium]|nr:tRNA (guanosine(37)-N1)-methyltransferase TrmD [Ardenticatenaceae bacterium]MCB9446235.1 tRNA (guanosine(37)-N1)-methyltransferase TrmD [Ardenticatenaceae bacterium]
MHIDILTLFPEMFPGYLNESILKRAQEMGQLSIGLHNIRDYAEGKHRVTDEPPYGGGGGMVLKPEPVFAAVEEIVAREQGSKGAREKHPFTLATEGRPPLHPIILLSPQGRPFTQQVAQELAQAERLVLLCGRYEGVDERVRQYLVTNEISIGDYVLTGGELAAMVVVDAVTRLLPGVLGAEDAANEDSYATGLLEGPHYTKPAEFRGWAVPEVLRSGHAANIARWRREQALRRTWQRRPDLLLTAVLTEADKQFLAQLAEEEVRRS